MVLEYAALEEVLLEGHQVVPEGRGGDVHHGAWQTWDWYLKGQVGD